VTPLPILLPAYRVQCLRCERTFDYECDCAPRDLGAAHPHDTGCVPTYRNTGGALPNFCPKCKAPRWLDPPKWRHGQGPAPSTIRRKRREARRR
jgi:hypothetical protein